MRLLLLVAASLSLAQLRAEPSDGGIPLTGLSGDGPWGALVGALGQKGPIQASFTERRYFSIRKDPTVLHGVIRISPEHGLSLGYTSPEVLTLVADSQGLIMRDARGHDRAVPLAVRQAGAIASLLPVMEFDIKDLAQKFEISAFGSPFDWRMDFQPREPGPLGTIIVWGRGTDVDKIEFRRSATQRIEIEVGDTHTGVRFTADDLRRYFRAPPAR